MKSKDLYNLVYLTHSKDGTGKRYVFQCPLHIKLEKGDEVSCNTVRGGTSGVCATNSFLVESETAKQITEIHGGTFPPEEVTGIAGEEVRKVYIPFEEKYS